MPLTAGLALVAILIVLGVTDCVDVQQGRMDSGVEHAEVYLDGQEIYSLKPAKNYRISKTVGSNWVMNQERPLLPGEHGEWKTYD